MTKARTKARRGESADLGAPDTFRSVRHPRGLRLRKSNGNETEEN
jgi:hypothetical protein